MIRMEMLATRQTINPIIIGGLGGSGTRVVAKILEDSGVHMGHYLNSKYDNLLFSVFGSPSRANWTYAQLRRYFILFEKLHCDRKLSIRDWMLLASRLLERHNRKNNILILRNAFKAKHKSEHLSSWGWKNGPNQYFIPQLNRHYPNCFYVHIIRHGLDMAFSKNQRQLLMYGPLFAEQSNDTTPDYVRQLDLWIKTNRWVTEYCTTHMPSRHYVLRFEELCKYPEKTIDELIRLTGISPLLSIAELARSVYPPESLLRYQSADLSAFSVQQLNAVRELGYEI